MLHQTILKITIHLKEMHMDYPIQFLKTAFFKPRKKSSKLSNLFYCGQLIFPGPGLPPSIISGEIAAGLVLKI